LFEHCGLSPEILPGITRSVFELNQGKLLGRYSERWKLLPGGRLEIEASIPILPPLGSDATYFEAPKLLGIFDLTRESGTQAPSAKPDSLEAFKRSNPALCKRVCGFKIQNASELAAWKTLDAGKYPDAARLFQKATQEQPKWPFALFGEAWARIGAAEFALARQALRNGRAALTPEYQPFLEAFGSLLEEQINAYELQKTAPAQDYFAFSESLAGKWTNFKEQQNGIGQLSRKKFRVWTPQDLQAAMQLTQEFPLRQELEKAVNMRGRGFIMPIGTPGLSLKVIANLPLSNSQMQQSLATMAIIEGHIYLAQNNPQRAASQYAAAVRLGQKMRHGILVSHLIGISVENAGLQALLELFEDGRLQDTQSVAFANQMADLILRGEPEIAPSRLFLFEFQILPISSDPMMEYLLRSTFANLQEVRPRELSAPARARLLKTTCALKVKNPKPPYPPQMDAADWLEDPFVKGQKIRYVPGAGGPATVFSCGPDQQNDHASVSYDPTNGARSAGDIFVRIR
jgi:tetratricopeptide (TPR) repeat protein